MQCAQHIDRGAVGTCNTCGRGLCSECMSTFDPPACTQCTLKHNSSVAAHLNRQLAVMAALFVIALIFLLDRTSFGPAIAGALIAAFFPAGWNFLGRYFSPGGGYRYPLARWMNLAVQAGLALMLGVVLGPIQLFQAWKQMQIVRDTKRNLTSQGE